MVPFYQGQLDCFCAAYAVMNALRLLHALPLTEARALFNSMLTDLARDPGEFAAVALNATDHTDWVERLLTARARPPRAVRFRWPFSAARVAFPHGNGPYTLDSGKKLINPSGDVSPGRLWEHAAGWLGAADRNTGPRALVFRFHRYLAARSFPVVSHWTAAGEMDDATLKLTDASVEPAAIHAIRRNGFVTERGRVSAEQLIQIEPCTLFLLERG